MCGVVAAVGAEGGRRDTTAKRNGVCGSLAELPQSPRIFLGVGVSPDRSTKIRVPHPWGIGRNLHFLIVAEGAVLKR